MDFSYSYCTTVYNSVEVIDQFIDTLKKSNKNYEIIVVDNNSTDGTFEHLKNKSGVKAIQEKCTRGKGRQISIENSSNDIIVMLDADVEYTHLDKVLTQFENGRDVNAMWNFLGRGEHGSTPMVVSSKETFERIGGYPDINAGEDSYIRILAESLGIYRKVMIEEGTFNGMIIQGKASGNESRYKRSLYSKLKNRAYFTRDTLFVHRFTYGQLIEFYKLKGLSGKLIGLAEYLIGKFLLVRLREENINERMSNYDLSDFTST